MDFQVTARISVDRIRCLLVSALEGGINYWACDLDYELAEGLTWDDFKPDGKYGVDDWQAWYTIPFVEGNALLIGEQGDDGRPMATHRLDRAAMQRGLDLMADPSKCSPFRLENLLEENDDAETADVWIQLACFGERVYS